MSDTTDVMLAHIQQRINRLDIRMEECCKRPMGKRSVTEEAQISSRVSELQMMLNVIDAANKLQMLAAEKKKQ